MNNKLRNKHNIFTSIVIIVFHLLAFCLWAVLPLIIYTIFGQIVSAVFTVIWFLINVIVWNYFVLPWRLPEKLWNYFTFLMWSFIVLLVAGFIVEIVVGRNSTFSQVFINYVLSFLSSIFLYGVVFGLIGSRFVSGSRISNSVFYAGWIIASILPQLLLLSSSPMVIGGGVVSLIVFLLLTFKKNDN